MTRSSAYDRYAHWYDEVAQNTGATHTSRVSELLLGLLGDGPGRVLDAGCGSGLLATPLQVHGWEIVGVDLSAAQLSIAVSRLPVARADVTALPIRPSTLDAVVATHVHTDLPDFAAAVAESARVLRPGGTFAYVGVHPCFVGPFAERQVGRVVLHEGYLNGKLTFNGPGLGDGLRRRVGVRQRTISDIVNAVPRAGLILEQLRESTDDGRIAPDLLGLSARRPAR